MVQFVDEVTKTLGMTLLVLSFSGAVAASDDRKATAELRLCSNSETVIGKAKLKEKDSQEGIKLVEIEIKVKGLTPGKHAVHIHETGLCEPCSTAGGHFDPGPMGFTSPDGNHPFHSGDLINIEGKDDSKGKGKLETETTRVTLSDGPLSLFDEDGSAFIIHDNLDTYCPDGLAAGCAGGSRFACGVILRKD